jgi:NAD(P)-dependent dehydrogenase (short-subunit alcohol dehydrogenase family)
MELRGARAIVTGGASGIGAACVSRLRDAGARVVVLDREPDPGASEGSAGDTGGVQVDVADEDGVVSAVATAVARVGGLDVAVLSAGVGGSMSLLDMTTHEWDRVVNVNLRGAFLCLRECARAMTGGGAIVAVSSISGFLADRLMAHYAVSKAGLAQLVRSAARELGARGIRVNAVAPGTTETPMFGATERLPGYRERVARRAALGRVGTADDVAQAIVALCTLDWVTGQVVAADGGVSLHSPIDPQESFDAPPGGAAHAGFGAPAS